MVATDIAARGIHVDGIDLVIHADAPAEHKAYLHRSGRTERAGADGVVVTLQTHAQGREVRALMGVGSGATCCYRHSSVPGHPCYRGTSGRRSRPATRARRRGRDRNERGRPGIWHGSRCPVSKLPPEPIPAGARSPLAARC